MLRLSPATPTFSRRLLTAGVCSPSGTSKQRAGQGSQDMHSCREAACILYVLSFHACAVDQSAVLGALVKPVGHVGGVRAHPQSQLECVAENGHWSATGLPECLVFVGLNEATHPCEEGTTAGW